MYNMNMIRDIQLVKESCVIENEGIVTCFHYGTKIIEIELSTKKILSEYKPSRTSSKMVNRVKHYYGLI